MACCLTTPCHNQNQGWVNSLRSRQNGRLFADDTCKRIFLNENIIISTKNSLKFVPKGLIDNIPALVLIMAWGRPGDKPLSDPMLIKSLTHICVTRPQWVNVSWIPGNRFQWNSNRFLWNLNQITKLFSQENAFENIICKVAFSSICSDLDVLNYYWSVEKSEMCLIFYDLFPKDLFPYCLNCFPFFMLLRTFIYMTVLFLLHKKIHASFVFLVRFF